MNVGPIHVFGPHWTNKFIIIFLFLLLLLLLLLFYFTIKYTSYQSAYRVRALSLFSNLSDHSACTQRNCL